MDGRIRRDSGVLVGWCTFSVDDLINIPMHKILALQSFGVDCQLSVESNAQEITKNGYD